MVFWNIKNFSKRQRKHGAELQQWYAKPPSDLRRRHWMKFCSKNGLDEKRSANRVEHIRNTQDLNPKWSTDRTRCLPHVNFIWECNNAVIPLNSLWLCWPRWTGSRPSCDELPFFKEKNSLTKAQTWTYKKPFLLPKLKKYRRHSCKPWQQKI